MLNTQRVAAELSHLWTGLNCRLALRKRGRAREIETDRERKRERESGGQARDVGAKAPT